MTEQEWLRERSIRAMLAFAHDRIGDRKRCLFACCRRVWHLIEDEPLLSILNGLPRCKGKSVLALCNLLY